MELNIAIERRTSELLEREAPQGPTLKPTPADGTDLLERSFDERKYRFEGFGEAYPRHCCNVLLKDLSEDIQTAGAHDVVNGSQEMGMAWVRTTMRKFEDKLL